MEGIKVDISYQITKELMAINTVEELESYMSKVDISKSSILAINLLLKRLFDVEKPIYRIDRIYDLIHGHIELYRAKQLQAERDETYLQLKYEMIYKLCQPYLSEVGDDEKLYINKLSRKSNFKAIEATPRDIQKALMIYGGYLSGREQTRGKKLYIIKYPDDRQLAELEKTDIVYRVGVM